MKPTSHLTESIFHRYAIVDSAAPAKGIEKLAKLARGSADAQEVLLFEQDTGS